MKRVLGTIILFAGALCAQTRNVVLTWTASVTPNVTYNVYRASAPCTPLPPPASFAKRNTVPVTAVTFTDVTVPTGPLCYYITAASASSGLESIPSNTLNLIVEAPPAPPTGASAQVVVVVNVTVNNTRSAQPAATKKK